MVIFFKTLSFRYRSLQWVLSCAASLQCCYLSSHVRWSWESQSCCLGSCSSRNISKSKTVLSFPFENNIQDSSLCPFFFFFVFSVLLLICVIVFWHSLSEIIPSAFLDPPHFCFCWSFPAPCLRLWSSRCSFYH